MWTLAFWQAAAERAAKTAANYALVSVGGDLTSVLHLDILGVLGAMGAGALVSVLMSVGSSQVGGPGPSLGQETIVASLRSPANPTPANPPAPVQPPANPPVEGPANAPPANPRPLAVTPPTGPAPTGGLWGGV